MDVNVKAKLLAALRNGQYKQGRRTLRRLDNLRDEYCCLGVLCDLYVQEHPEVFWELDVNSNIWYLLRQSATLPNEVILWANVMDDNPFINGIPLAGYNDGYDFDGYVTAPLSFEQIADLIEEYL